MKKFIIFCSLFFISFSVFAQSADVITQILNSKEVTTGQLAYLAACNQNLITDDASFDEAVDVLIDNSLMATDATALDIPTIETVAKILAKNWHVKGGLFFKMTKGSARYAFKQLKADGIISPRTDPKTIISGRQALDLITKCNVLYGKMQFTDDPEEE
ncbi:MAG: hypothetical protein K6D95_08700 [Treponema sp.]|nr:hypothetical protein [Treponema sp.]